MYDMSKRIEMIGNKYGRLTVISKSDPSMSGQTRYLCKCDCGNEKVFQAANIRNGKSLSCGCIRKEVTASRNRIEKKTHGMCHTREYKIWAGMLVRCAVDHPKYSAHFGRGIKVCERWSKFENFISDMGQRPSSNHSIDRINNDGDYEPNNCRWATSKEQTRNTRYNVKYTFEGKTMILNDWAIEKHINPITVYWRFKKGLRGHDLFKPPYRLDKGSK